MQFLYLMIGGMMLWMWMVYYRCKQLAWYREKKL